MRNISFRFLVASSRVFRRRTRARATSTVSRDIPRSFGIHVTSNRSIDPSTDVQFIFDTRERRHPSSVVAYLLDVFEGGDSLGLDGLLRDGRLGDDADAGEGGSEGGHDDDFCRGRACCEDALDALARSETRRGETEDAIWDTWSCFCVIYV